jgi:uncharacterized protein
MSLTKTQLIRYRMDLLNLPSSVDPATFSPAVRSGRFDILYPEEFDFAFLDIANALAKICRYTGQGSEFFSVAEHCVLLSKRVPQEYAFEALMHDATESVLGDVSAPLKALLPSYHLIEGWSDVVVRKKYGLPTTMSPIVKQFDNDRVDEMNALFGDGDRVQQAASANISFLKWRDAYSAFVSRALELKHLGLVPNCAIPLLPALT